MHHFQIQVISLYVQHILLLDPPLLSRTPPSIPESQQCCLYLVFVSHHIQPISKPSCSFLRKHLALCLLSQPSALPEILSPGCRSFCHNLPISWDTLSSWWCQPLSLLPSHSLALCCQHGSMNKEVCCQADALSLIPETRVVEGESQLPYTVF